MWIMKGCQNTTLQEKESFFFEKKKLFADNEQEDNTCNFQLSYINFMCNEMCKQHSSEGQNSNMQDIHYMGINQCIHIEANKSQTKRGRQFFWVQQKSAELNSLKNCAEWSLQSTSLMQKKENQQQLELNWTDGRCNAMCMCPSLLQALAACWTRQGNALPLPTGEWYGVYYFHALQSAR